MVYKHLEHFKLSKRERCGKMPMTKRPISVGASIEQKPWKPTVRKGQIRAEAITGKPSYKTIPPYLGSNIIDSRKKSAPAYSLGNKIRQHRIHINDGPAELNICGLCNKGKQTAPAFTLKGRTKDVKKFQSPSPNIYSTAKAFKLTSKTIPTFSFGKKPAFSKTLPTPAPNVYNLPPVFSTAREGKIKTAPAFSMTGRSKPRKLPALLLPGPGDYENNYRCLQKIPPSYSIHIKHKIINDDHITPGPAAYCPERYFKHKSVPAPSFSIQHTTYLGSRKAFVMNEHTSSSKPKWIL